MDRAMMQAAHYLWSQSGQIAVLIAAVAVINYLLRNRSAHARYLLWLLVVAKCLVPPLFGVAVPILPQESHAGSLASPDQDDSAATAGPTSGSPETLVMQEPTEPVMQMHPTHSLMPAISRREAAVLLWLAGLIVFVAIASVKTGRMMRQLRKERMALPTEVCCDIGDLFNSLGVERVPKVWLVESAGQPFVWGLWRGDVYLPANFVTLGGSEQRRDILAHELSHVLRFDAAVNLLQILAQAIFWFHPLVWWANARIRQEREKCCDETAIARLGTKPHSYSRAIVEVLLAEHESKGPLPSLAIAGPARNIEERIRTMLRPGKRFYRRPSLPAAACALLLALLIVPTTLALTNRPVSNGHVQVEDTKTQTDDEQTQQRVLSADKLKKIGLALIMYTMDHDGKYPEEFMAIAPYFGQGNADELTAFISNDAEYPGAGKTRTESNAHEVPLAYDLTLLRGDEGTNVVFADGHVEFVSGHRLDKYGVKLPESRLEIQDIRFEPIHQGKNIVHVTVKNTSDQEQVFAAHIYTRSPDYGEGGVGWGTGGYFETLRSEETRPLRLVFKIQGPITARTYVNLRFYNPEAQDKYDYKRYFERHKYASMDLEKARAEAVTREPASPVETQGVTQAFTEIQSGLRDGKYQQVWERFTKDYQKAEYQVGFEWFRRAMEPEHPMHSAFTWERNDFLKLTPGQVLKRDAVLTLTAALVGQTWTIDFVREDSQWKIDWIAGYTPTIIRIQKEESPTPAGGSGNLMMPQ
jgi:prepilin-type processing-associated H-X9-DG protein